VKIGVIAEDYSDVAVMKQITLTLLKPHRVGFRPFIGDGCGKLRRKVSAWARILVKQECESVLVIHDLDRFDERELRSELSPAVADCGARVTVVLIPKQEIEAWLLYDKRAIAQAFREKAAPKLPGNPESLNDPKKYLRELVWKKYHKHYLNTVHNETIAKHIDVSLLKRSESFAPQFVFASAVKKILR
jgi:Domain of unknown function (DUF4276)